MFFIPDHTPRIIWQIWTDIFHRSARTSHNSILKDGIAPPSLRSKRSSGPAISQPTEESIIGWFNSQQQLQHCQHYGAAAAVVFVSVRCASFRFQIVTGRQSHIYDNITTSTSDKTTIPHAIPSINQSTWIRSSSVAMQQRGDATQQRDATATPRYTTKIYSHDVSSTATPKRFFRQHDAPIN